MNIESGDIMKTIKDMNIKNKKVLIRCDFNVPIKDGKIVDDSRIQASLETINYALKEDAKVILFSHLGRIKEESDLSKNSLAIVSDRLAKLLKHDVLFVEKTRGEQLEDAINSMEDKDVILVQNTRYEDLAGKKESGNDKELGAYWASLGDVFINDAFGTCHRAHASNVGISSHLPSAVGFLVEKELKALDTLKWVKSPFIIILGGSKVEDKIGVINTLAAKADYILIGGGMAFTFLKAEGYEVGNSLIDSDNIEFAKEMLNKYAKKIILPIDVITSLEIKDDVKTKTCAINEIEYNEMGLDIGPNTIKLFQKYLECATMVLWNGPLGVYEYKNFAKGTKEVMTYLVDNNIKTILGGGDIVAASAKFNLKDKVFHASTGGGATLEYIEKGTLPALEVIE